MNLEEVQRLIDEAQKAHVAVQDLRAKHRGEDGSFSAEHQANIDTATDAMFEAKAAADAGVKELKAARLIDETSAGIEDLQGWASKSAGMLPGISANTAGSDEGNEGRVAYKNRNGKVEYSTPTGYKNFSPAESVEYADVFRRFLSGGAKSLSEKDMALAERKALSVGSDTSGGFLTASEIVRSELIQALEDAVIMRQLGTVLPALTTATSIRIGTASDLDDSTWTSELLTGSNDTSTPFGSRALRPHPLAKRIKISNTLLRLATIDVEAWVRGEIANRFAKAEEAAFMTGTGFNQPEGVFTSSLTTDVTASFAASPSTGLHYKDLVEMEGSLKRQYRAGASWIFHRTVMKHLYQLMDGNDRPILREIPSAGMQFSILGYNVNESEYAPSTLTTGLDVGALGDWKQAYYIVDSLGTTIQVVDQLYAESNEVGYIARKETDGMVVSGEGVSILKLA